MKKILSLVLALALVLAASAAFADVPGNIKDIEGLPEMPEVPTMTTSVSGTTETIVVSEKLNWLNWINNWNWNQIEWSEDGLTGTFSLAGLKSQPGYGNWLSWSEWGGPYWYEDEDGEWHTIEAYSDSVKLDLPSTVCTRVPHEHIVKKYSQHTDPSGYVVEVPYEVTGCYSTFNDDGYKVWHKYAYLDTKEVRIPSDQTWEEDGEAINLKLEELYISKIAAAREELREKYGDEVDDYGWVWYDENGYSQVYEHTDGYWFGTYDLNGTVGWAPVYSGMAFDGEAANGAHVRYDRFGRPISITATLTGVNFLNMDTEPVKTEVTWGVSVTEFGRKWYIASIKAYIDDETAVEAGFASGGKLLKVK